MSATPALSSTPAPRGDDAPVEGIPSWAHVMPEHHAVFVTPPLATLVSDIPDLRFRVFCYFVDSLRQWVLHVVRNDGAFARRVAVIDPDAFDGAHPPAMLNTHALMLFHNLRPRIVRLDAPAAKLTDGAGCLLFHFCLSSELQQRWIAARLVFCARNQPPDAPKHAGSLDPLSWPDTVGAPDARGVLAASAAQQLVEQLAAQAADEASAPPRSERRSPTSGAERGSHRRQRDQLQINVRPPLLPAGRELTIVVRHFAPHALGYTTVRERVRVQQGDVGHADLVTEHRFPRASSMPAGTVPLRLVSARIFQATTEPVTPPPTDPAVAAETVAAAAGGAPNVSMVRAPDGLVELEDLLLVRRIEAANLENEATRARVRDKVVRILEHRLAAWRAENGGDASAYTAHTRMVALLEKARRSSCSIEHLKSIERGYCAVLDTYERERATLQAPSMLGWERC